MIVFAKVYESKHTPRVLTMMPMCLLRVTFPIYVYPTISCAIFTRGFTTLVHEGVDVIKETDLFHVLPEARLDGLYEKGFVVKNILIRSVAITGRIR